MKFNSTTSLALFIVLLLFVFINYSAAEITFAGDVTGVTTYIWRGIKQYTGPAMQGTAAFTYSRLTLGLWSSSMASGDIEVETDPYIEVSLPTGSITTAIGATVYSYNMLKTFNADADCEYEIYGKTGYGPVGIAGFFVPSQSSTENNLNESDYWVELTGKTALKGADLGLVLGYGTYSSKWLATPKEEAVGNIVFSAGKAVTEKIAVKWSYSLALDDDMNDYFWMTASCGF